ncbi:TPA: hypothetical protein N0F65_004429 [Lagenidium giganteum]|uniref:Upstream activation factor subunit spp27 n=1 Tax=Lagenidium giganteum TaxID=4803 RepID=A0AAV2ZDL1_9STRA|nr:TPA: hypothetical protein N0F65_004429 [Lagenidium giganteum]
MADEGALRAAIERILVNADLEQLSRRMIRKQLEEELGTDLSAQKDFINTTILEVIEQQQEADAEPDAEEAQDDQEDEDGDDEDEEEDHKPRKVKKSKAKTSKRGASGEGGGRGGAFNALLMLSPELAAVMGSDQMARPQIVKKMWEYIREHELQDPNNKRNIRLDETLKNVFKRDSVTMFSMNKYIKRHVRKPDDLPPGGWAEIPRDGASSDEEDGGKASKSAPKRKAAVKRKKRGSDEDDDDGEGSSKKKNSGFNKELSLSPELADLVGSDRMARPQIVKKLWEYIREHELQDPKNKRNIRLDERMRAVFKRKSFTMFSMNKFVKRHVRKPEDLPADGWASVHRDGRSSDEDE